MSLSRRIARPLLASIFLADGIEAVRRPDSHVEKFHRMRPLLEKAGMREVDDSDTRAIVRATGVVTTVAAVMLATSRSPRSAALTLAAVTIPLTVVNNPVWATSDRGRKREMRRGLLRGAAFTGGLLLAAVDRDGKPSFAWRLANEREHRAALRELKASLKA